MQTELKREIADRANQYMKDNNLKAVDFGRDVNVNESYLSNILNYKFEASAGDNKLVPIKDTYFKRIAEVVGVSVEKKYWGWVETREFEELVGMIKDAKEKTITKTLICATGKGKTYAVNKFKTNFPANTYVITINSLMNLSDIINELLYLLNLPVRGSKAARIREVIMKFRELRRNGHRPLLILDEGENMNGGTMRMIKGLYDGICQDHYASIVLMGTDQLLKKMESNRKKDKEAAPQFYRRFKAGLRVIKEVPVNKAFVPFFSKFGITDKGLRSLLCEICDNYGELHDCLEPAMREADEQGEELTEDFFRIMYNMPK
jgi:DNA transposition AAA+ family ATPase